MLPERVYFPKLPLYVRYWYFGPLIATCFFLYSFSGILLSSGLIKAKLEIAAVPVFLAFLGFLSWYIQPLKITLGEYICIHRKKPLSSKCIDYRDIASIGAGRLKLKKGGYSWRLFVNSSELDDIFDDLIQRKVIHFEDLNDLVVREDRACIYSILFSVLCYILFAVFVYGGVVSEAFLSWVPEWLLDLLFIPILFIVYPFFRYVIFRKKN